MGKGLLTGGNINKKRVREATDSDLRIYAGSTCSATRSRHGHSSM
jgi:hypothetical protein